MKLTNVSRTISLIGACAFVALSPTLQAVLPAPDGGYSGDNTAEGQDALLNLVVGSTTGIYNTAVGFDALYSNTDGVSNTAIGLTALQTNTTGGNNTATGIDALQGNTTGNFNTGTGSEALYSNTTGTNNTAIGGFQTLFSNTTGSQNTATGSFALTNNTAGNDNTATGFDALLTNSTASFNTATGSQALFSNTTGHDNTANGRQALFSNTNGFFNTATASDALFSNTSGSDNTASGVSALTSNTTGSDNTATGLGALSSNNIGSDNTATGVNALNHNTSGSSNIALGVNAGANLTTGSNNIDVGNAGVAGESSVIRIGTKPAQKNAFVAGISGVTVASGVGVIINTQGKLGTVVSSARFKDAIKPMDKASEAILALKPVTFRYKHELDPEGIPQFGLVAEQVEKVNPDLVARDEEGKAYTVRYEAVNAMLLNEFLKEHRKVEELEVAVAKLQSVVQKVSNQMELTKPVSQVVSNN